MDGWMDLDIWVEEGQRPSVRRTRSADYLYSLPGLGFICSNSSPEYLSVPVVELPFFRHTSIPPFHVLNSFQHFSSSLTCSLHPLIEQQKAVPLDRACSCEHLRRHSLPPFSCCHVVVTLPPAAGAVVATILAFTRLPGQPERQHIQCWSTASAGGQR